MSIDPSPSRQQRLHQHLEPSPSKEEWATQLRDALAAALASTLARARSARDFARRLGLDKSIGWKVWRMATAPNGRAVLRVIPKQRGVKRIAEALRRKGIPAVQVDEIVRLAHGALVAEEHERRAAADEMVDSANGRQTIPRLSSRAQVARREEEFGIATRTLGYSVEMRVGAFLLAPDRTGDRVSLAAATLVVGPRAARPGSAVRVYMPIAGWEGEKQPQLCGDEGELVSGVPGLVKSLCTEGLDESQFSRVDQPPEDLLPWLAVLPRPGTPETLAFLEVARGVGAIHAAEPHDFGSLSLVTGVPTRRVIFDVFFHRSLPVPHLTASYRTTKGVLPSPMAGTIRLASPFPDGAVLDCKRPGLGAGFADADARYRRLLAYATGALDRPLGEFQRYRVSLQFPAYMGHIVIDWPLPIKRPLD